MDLCTFVFSYLLPVLVLGLTYARTLRYLWRAVDPVAAGSGTRRAKRKVTRMIVIVAALFCLCWMPHHALILCVWFGRFSLTRATYALRILSHLVSYSNPCDNPIVYALVSKHFRKICACLLRRAPRRASGRVCVAAQGTRNGSVLERESTDVTHARNPTALGSGVWLQRASGWLWVSWQDQSPQARVDRDGHIELYLALTTETYCDFELFHFPRDQSDCSLSFFAFGNTVMELEFQAHAVNEILRLQNTALKAVIALLVPGEALLLADLCGPLLPLRTERIAYKFTTSLSYAALHHTTETVLLSGLLGHSNPRAESSPSPVLRGEQHDCGSPGPDPEEASRGVKGSRRSWPEAADHIFFLVYVAGVLCSQFIFAVLWMWATCKSDPAPGEAAPHGGWPRL
ncbi:hypothetical protein E2I00_008327 [Balaenoptera physalus]|uniref:G-protein coupled receptors family 1 profile domain-containing protein n=1 Tax=Balaenoptera physalus TaxID=9770 RepID=A0A6A1Q3L4_BALPH|nr:hypothetical protein E2I00_008327 [Balaenoptera physalus]